MSLRSLMKRGGAGVLALVLPTILTIGAANAQDREFGGEIELVDPNILRVCADPANLPFANEEEQGFEQEVAELLAEKLGRESVAYTYFPQATGFVRMTLGSNLCDIIMSYPQGDELVQNTNAYYRTAYAIVVPADGELADVEKLEDEVLQGKRLGIVAGTPPATYLARAGLIGLAKPYQLVVDTRVDNSAKAMMEDLESGEIDGAVLWGPLAGWYSKQADEKFKVIPLVNEPQGPAMAYRITMGVRSSDQQWKRTLNVAIRDNQEEINEILLSYGIPLLTEDDEPIESANASATSETQATQTVPDASPGAESSASSGEAGETVEMPMSPTVDTDTSSSESGAAAGDAEAGDGSAN